MLTKGETLTLESGRRVIVERSLGEGGQGEAFLVTGAAERASGVVKLFRREYQTPATEQRIRFLIARQLPKLAPELATAPTDLVLDGGRLGHFAAYSPGPSLEDFLLGVTPDAYPGQLWLARRLATVVNLVHESGLLLADLHPGNILVEQHRGRAELRLIDLDNFAAPGQPPSPLLGFPSYLAPEQRRAEKNGGAFTPTPATEVFQLCFLLHEMLLLRHPRVGIAESFEALEKSYEQGWLFGPEDTTRVHERCGGLPPRMLNSDLARLLRAGMDPDSAKRPSARDCFHALRAAAAFLYRCPACTFPDFLDVGKRRCPSGPCGREYPTLGLELPDGSRIGLLNGQRFIGREQLGGAVHVSARHLELNTLGPRAWVTPLGRNPTERWDGARYAPLRNGAAVAVIAGDRLSLAGVEVRFV